MGLVFGKRLAIPTKAYCLDGGFICLRFRENKRKVAIKMGGAHE